MIVDVLITHTSNGLEHDLHAIGECDIKLFNYAFQQQSARVIEVSNQLNTDQSELVLHNSTHTGLVLLKWQRKANKILIHVIDGKTGENHDGPWSLFLLFEITPV